MTDFILPDIGEGVVECELLEWLVAEGETVEEDQPVAEVMTDKATVQIPAMHGGTITRLYYKPGDIAKVHAPLFELKQKGAAESSLTTADDPDDVAVIESAHTNQTETFFLPDIGEGIVECEIVKWQVNEGDAVEEDDVVLEVMTDKAVVEIPAKHAGILLKRHYAVGDIAKVHQPLFELSVGRDTLIDKPKLSKPSTKDSKMPSEHGFTEGNVAPPKIINGKVPASPAVRRLAKENNLMLSDITPSGKKGRVLKLDVLKALEANDNKLASVSVCQPHQSTNQAEDKVVPLTPVQKAMAKQMKRSVSTIPHFTVSDELHINSLIELKSMLQAQFSEQDIKLTFMPFFIKALSLSLNDFPILNARVNEDETALHYCADHNIGFAVDSQAGLLVPNIKQVQSKSLQEIAVDMQRIVSDAKQGRVSAADLKGGTISISNVGVLGGITATPIINAPELAIVALGKIQHLPRFDEKGEVISRSIMQVSWSADHRVIDGATMVRFNNLWLDYLQNPMKMLSKLH